MKPLCIDLFCGLGGWSEAFLAEGYDCIGFDIERHDYGTGGYPGQLVLQDVRTLHGAQFKDAAVIVASPPCQEFSYRAMPWKRGKAQVPDVLPDWWEFPESDMSADQLAEWKEWQLAHPLQPPDQTLFNACFRIQREASEAAGRNIPLIVENVRGAQPWVGRARAHYGSYYIWGSVEMVGNKIVVGPRREWLTAPGRIGGKFNPDGTAHGQGSWFAIADSKNRGASIKNPGMTWSKFGEPGYKPEGFNVRNAQLYRDEVKTIGHVNKRDGYSHTRHLTNQRESDAVKQHGSGPIWFDTGIAKHSSKSNRKAASAMIARIPFPLAQHIARCFRP